MWISICNIHRILISIRWVVGNISPFFDFYGYILASISWEELMIKNIILSSEVSVLYKLRDIFRFAQNLVNGWGELNFSDDDSELTYFRGIYFAEVICDFDDIKGFNALSCWGILGCHDIRVENGVGTDKDAIKKCLFIGDTQSKWRQNYMIYLGLV